MTKSEQLYVALPENLDGRDFVVGDIHGCRSKLEEVLARVSFSPKVDRLISVGDLVDRGPDSLGVIAYLNNPWFYAVRGNHEELALLWARGKISTLAYQNLGGLWNLAQSPEKQVLVAHLFAKLPMAFEVPVKGKVVGITHADCPYPDWGEFEQALKGACGVDEQDFAYQLALWSRSRFNLGKEECIEGIDSIYVGHNPVEAVERRGNITYLDTGAVFEDDAPLTLICLQDDV